MLTRITHAAIAFALLVVIYQGYVLLAVPFLEPVSGTQDRAVQDGITPPRQAPHKYRDLLAAYFPPGHWALANPPKTFEDGRVMIILDNYRTSDTGLLRINKCALLFFPNSYTLGDVAPRDAVILEAPHGAVLQLDEGVRPGLGGIGRVQHGKLLGDITVRSDMREPGSQDDLLLTTRDVDLREDLIRTDAEVDVQLGPHRGHGRVMEIRLVEVESSESAVKRVSSGSIESLEILHDVQARLVPGNTKLSAGSPSQTPAPPVQVNCQGRFCFHFAHSKAFFEDQVKVEQIHPTGERDLLLCHTLSLFLTKGSFAKKASQNELRPGSIQALGTVAQPVELDAQSQQATARCEKMWLELQSRRITLDGNDEVMLSYQGSEIHAPMIRYQAPALNASHRIGTLQASGNGWISVRGDRVGNRSAGGGKNTSSEPMEMRWTKELRLYRIGGKPVLSVRGRPRLELLGLGRLWAANDLDVYLRESAIDGSEANLLPAAVVPERIVASGEIDVDSSQLSGKVNQLDVRIQYASSHLDLGSPGRGRLQSSNLRNPSASGRSRAYHIDGKRLQMLLTVRDQQPEVTRIDVEGDVHFSETASIRATPEEPLIVRASQLHIENADSPSAEISLHGKPATVTAAGISIRAEKLNLNRGTSRAWIESPGELVIPVDQDFSGKALATKQMMTIRWQGGMELDQDRVIFRQGVEVEAGEGWLKTKQLTTHFSVPIRFDGAASQQRAQLAQLQCSGGADAQFSQRDATGLTSVQTITLEESLVVNQQTGLIHGQGGGRLESVHLSKGNHFANQTPQNHNRGQQLQFLQVNFVRGIEGNLNRRHVAVLGDVEAVYGPVDSWDEKLEKSVRGMPELGTTWISCQKLGVAENPLARLQQRSGIGPLEFLAEGDVIVEGRVGERGSFTATSEKATYDQLKTMFLLEGTGRLPATLTHEQFVGAPPSETAARKIIYIHKSGEVKVEGIVRGGWKQIDMGQKPRSPQVR